MWKSHPEEKPGSSNLPTQRPVVPANVNSAAAGKETQPLPQAKTSTDPFRAEVAAHIGKSVVIKGELSGSEDLYLDGEVEGTIELENHTLVIGPNARIRANIGAKEVVIHGKIEGNISGSERVELRKSCVLSGDIHTRRIVIEEGAFFKGSVDLEQAGKVQSPRAAAASAGVSASSAQPLNSQTSFLEHS